MASLQQRLQKVSLSSESLQRELFTIVHGKPCAEAAQFYIISLAVLCKASLVYGKLCAKVVQCTYMVSHWVAMCRGHVKRL